ncbi:hypothetical protein AK812_SmicGene43637 [Symbiodinium microadriaticum]|uniref:Uncharacterized protein n=1 Tax=Symbiodinium microadriaticum TaxID=2951 RepID=A0A1Q9C0I3_SYMMI|nr:hypothetical protein AK812_SmicGene43637 [Symbiodinium microadriaticum]
MLTCFCHSANGFKYAQLPRLQCEHSHHYRFESIALQSRCPPNIGLDGGLRKERFQRKMAIVSLLLQFRFEGRSASTSRRNSYQRRADASNAFDGESQLAGCHKPEDDLRQQPDNRKVAIDSRERCRETAPQPTKAAQAAKLKQPAVIGCILRVLPLLGGMLAQAGAGTANPGALTLRLNRGNARLRSFEGL